ncbi:MAG: MmgE/PrpD family protein, partial [Pseudomonadota bacterium]
IYAGAETEVALHARGAVRAMGADAGPATVIGTEMRASRPHAAFLNALAGHALDFDDWEIPGNTHPSVVLVPALLAVADDTTSGADFARAYLAGFEVIARLGEALNFAHYDAGWHSTATLGAPGAAAGCARLLGLTTDGTANALSLAISATSGYTCQFGSHAKPAQAGFAARAGVEAACLAQAGMTGQAHVLDHPRGMAALMDGLDPDRLSRALSKLGKVAALAEYGLVFKPWPSCGYTHRIMTCVLSVRAQVQLDQVASIDIHLPDFHAAVLPFGVPRDRSEALFSLPFVTAIGLATGGLNLADLTREAWQEPGVLDLMRKTKVHAFSPQRPDQNYAEEDPDRLIVSLTDGRMFETACLFPTGAPQAPMSASQFWEKFESNLGPKAEADATQAWIARLRMWPEAPRIHTLLCRQG